jgi:deoxyhypusine synthase
LSDSKNRWLNGRHIDPDPVREGMTVSEIIDSSFLAFNAGQLQKAARLLVEKMLAPDCRIGFALSGAMTPAGLGQSVIIPMIRAGFIDWMVSTGANLYHDAHFGLGMALHRGASEVDDNLLFRDGVVRIYDIFFEYDVLLKTDSFMREIMNAAEFQEEMSTARLHHLLGKYLAAREDELGIMDSCVLSAAYRRGVPCYVSSPGDSSIGLNVAELWLKNRGPRVDVSLDVNETSALVYETKKSGLTSAVFIVGGGSPKNFVLQTEPQIKEILGLKDEGHDYFLQITDARADTGGLSGATPAEAVTWGKVDPSKLPDTVVVYSDATIALPLLAAYALDKHENRPLSRLYDKRESMLDRLRKDFLARQESLPPA